MNRPRHDIGATVRELDRSVDMMTLMEAMGRAAEAWAKSHPHETAAPAYRMACVGAAAAPVLGALAGTDARRRQAAAKLVRFCPERFLGLPKGMEREFWSRAAAAQEGVVETAELIAKLNGLVLAKQHAEFRESFLEALRATYERACDRLPDGPERGTLLAGLAQRECALGRFPAARQAARRAMALLGPGEFRNAAEGVLRDAPEVSAEQDGRLQPGAPEKSRGTGKPGRRR